MSDLVEILKAYRGSAKQVIPLTEENFTLFQTPSWGYGEFKQFIINNGLDVNNFFITDSIINNSFYIDYDNGVYLDCYNFSKEIMEYFKLSDRVKKMGIHQRELLDNGDYELFYRMLPEAMRVYDFQKRYKEISPENIADVWIDIYISLDYGFDVWQKEVLDYIFQFKKPNKRKKPFVIYRGIGTESTPLEQAYSWTTDIDKALWFATRRSSGQAVIKGIVNPNDVIFFINERNEKEVIVRYEDVMDIEYLDIAER